MIEDYFLTIEKVLQDFPTIRSRALAQKVYNHHQGYLSGKIVFENGYSLEFLILLYIHSHQYHFHHLPRTEAGGVRRDAQQTIRRGQ